MTAAELAVQSNITANTLSSVENGRRDLKVENLCSIARALHVSLEQIQPEELDVYSATSPEMWQLFNALKKLPANEQRWIIEMFLGEIEVYSSRKLKS